MFYSVAETKLPYLLSSSSHPSSLTCTVTVGPAQLSIGAGGAVVAYLRKLFGKDGLTQPTLSEGRGELPHMVQPMQRLRAAVSECGTSERV